MKKLSLFVVLGLTTLSIVFFVVALLSSIGLIYVAYTSFWLLLLSCVTFIIIKKRRFLSFVALALSIVLIVPTSILIFKKDVKTPQYVIHAGGAMENNKYLNSIEGLEYYIENDQTLIELDFLFTKDNEIICSHFFEYYDGFSIDNRPTLEEVKSTKLLDKYSSITFDNLIEVLKANPEVKIIFDTKEEDSLALINQMIEEASVASFDIKSRFIIQVYSLEDYETLNALDFDEYWFTNYKAYYSPNKINQYFGDKENVTTIVLYHLFWTTFRAINFETDKKVAVHTINDEYFIDFMAERGVDYVYTDILHK